MTFVKNKRLRNMGMKISLKVLRQKTEKHCRKLQRKTVTQEHRGAFQVNSKGDVPEKGPHWRTPEQK